MMLAADPQSIAFPAPTPPDRPLCPRPEGPPGQRAHRVPGGVHPREPPLPQCVRGAALGRRRGVAARTEHRRGWISLSSLKSLKALDVSKTTFDGRALDIVTADLPCLEQLDISDTAVGDLDSHCCAAGLGSS